MIFLILIAAILVTTTAYILYKSKNKSEVSDNNGSLPKESCLLSEDLDSYPKPNREERAAILLDELEEKLSEQKAEVKPKTKATKPKTMAAKRSSKKA
jgi:hypothetical protein